MSLLLREVMNYNINDSSKYTCNYIDNDGNSNGSEIKEQYSHPIASRYTGGYKTLTEACHIGVVTGNYTRYMQQAVAESLNSWTEPYQIPVIMYHNDYDGVIVGRVLKAYTQESVVKKGTQCLLLETSIPEYNFSDKVMSGLLKTVSIGVEGEDVRCSICGSQIAGSHEDRCDHVRGVKYDGELCTWDVYKYVAKELSYVITPSDPYAQVIDVVEIVEPSTEQCEVPQKAYSRRLSDSKKNNKILTEGASVKNMDLQEQLNDTKRTLKMVETEREGFKAERDALQGDKLALTESIANLNKEKISLQESIKQYKVELEANKTELAAEKQLKEQAESKITALQEEVKLSLIESLTSLRAQANKAEIDKEELSKRSVDSLRDSLNDLRSEIKESLSISASGAVQNEALLSDEKDSAASIDTNTKKEDLSNFAL